MTNKLRFAPSPTGFLHLGNARMAVFNYLYAQQVQGEFILRLDDTDSQRVTEEYIQGVKEDLKWLGISWNHEFKQSERIDYYNKMLQKLIAENKVYPCYENPEELEYKKKLQIARGKPPIYDRSMLNIHKSKIDEYIAEGRKPHYRLLIDHKTISWHDIIKGNIQFDGNNISDPIIVREDGSFLYILTSVLDDIETKITHIIRGEDHITNTAVQIQLFQYFNAPLPTFAHLPLLTSMSGAGLSKRNSSLSLRGLKKQAIHPMAINNYLYNLGLGEQNIIYETLADIASIFTLEKYNSASTKFDETKIQKLNLHWLQNMEDKTIIQLSSKLLNLDINSTFWHIIKNNIKTFEDITLWYNICYKDITTTASNSELIQTALKTMPQDSWNESTWNTWLTSIKTSTQLKNKEIFKPLRVALSGVDYGPELKELILLIGIKRITQRLKNIV